MKNEMLIGAAYYPEMWEESEVQKDIDRCKAYGINVLRVGEFAWAKMEPKEGQYDLGWLERAVDQLYEAGIMTVMCTPSCTPPRWLMNKYEEARLVSGDTDRRVVVSSRVHTCKTSPILREKNKQIVTELAKTFGKHPGVIGWQIDNELYPYGEGCYCDLCKAAFRKYLQKKYGTIENLNQQWGMVRWSLTYDSFEDVDAPYPNQWRHPSLVTEWRRFQCEQIADFVNDQADIIHQYSSAPVGTDMMPLPLLGYYQTNEKLDILEFNHYNPAEKISDPCFFYNFMRPIKEHPFWVTETQVGWNGATSAGLGYRPEGNCYANTWLPIAYGGEANMYWLFRSHPNGHELGHGSVFNSAGRPYRVSEEVREASRDMAKCADFLRNTRVKSRIALHYSHVSTLNFLSAPVAQDFNYERVLMEKFHQPLMHHNVDVIDTPHAVDEYDVVFSPFLTTIEGEFREKMERFVENGGTWIVGPMSDIMTDYTSKYSSAPFSFLEEYVGVYTKYQKPVPNTVFKGRFKDGTSFGISTYYDAFECREAASLADYDCHEFDGLSVIAERKIGKGKVILLGSVPDADTVRKLSGIAKNAEATENLRVVERSGEQNGFVVVEVMNQEGKITLEEEYTELITGEKMTGEVTVKPYQVLVLKK